MPDGPASVRSRLQLFAVLGVAGGGLTWLVLALFDRSVRPWLVIALVTCAALLTLVAVLAFERQPVQVVASRRDSDDGADPGSTRYTAELDILERRIDAAMSDPERFARVLTPLLADLAAQRLRSRRNLDLRSEPARQLLGEDLWRMTISSAPLPTGPTRPQLTEWIGRIEAI
ncbi:MAG TPA: hypothetical protein VGN18_02630 [Jatrophihabitans sp.]|jgi:hypothetical protein|uniref:hypothetical protein n=1 Tax=Jatrophihabitans sp. TaxID=1932789 RepID=UPI002DFB355F|nr:hypothetical protein [Jatrophihabitans sp.]